MSLKKESDVTYITLSVVIKPGQTIKKKSVDSNLSWVRGKSQSSMKIFPILIDLILWILRDLFKETTIQERS